MLETYSEQQLQTLVGYEVKDSAGEKVGYVDLVFLDDQTGQPEWIGIWNGLPRGHHYLAPLQGITHEGDSVRVLRGRRSRSSPLRLTTSRTLAASSSVRAITSRSPRSRRKRLTVTTGSSRPERAVGDAPAPRLGYEVRAERIRV